MLDHVTISVRDYQTSKAFYLHALKPIGYHLAMEVDGYAGFGPTECIGPIATFWIYQGDQPSGQTHIAFNATERNQVDAFYRAALKAGGKDNGAPGVRELYHPDYYGAFVYDPDGNNLEVVCHEKPITS